MQSGRAVTQLPEAQERKARSIVRLKSEGVPVYEGLPVIECWSTIQLRALDEIVNRAAALTMVAVKGELGQQPWLDKIVEENGLKPYFSPSESQFISDVSPAQHERTQFTWRYEAVGVLLWAACFIDELGRPDTIVDVPGTVGFLRDYGRNGMQARARLRPTGEIVDQADLIYRYHWAVREASVNGNPSPAGLDPGVVQERHHALNWLIRYSDADWDDVTTDT